jgi:nucleoside-diphosphate-sugar epimerase
VVSNFLVQGIRGEPLTLYGEGSQTRSFCYVDDLVDGIWRLFHSDYAGPVNLGNPDEFTIRELAAAVLALTGARSTLTFQPLPEDDPKVRCPEITLARTLLGWEPRVPLAEGLTRTLPWFSSEVAARDARARTLGGA